MPPRTGKRKAADGQATAATKKQRASADDEKREDDESKGDDSVVESAEAGTEDKQEDSSSSSKAGDQEAAGMSHWLHKLLAYDELLALGSSKGAVDAAVLDAYQAVFRKIADRLLNETVLNIGGQQWRLSEIEFYYQGDSHPDPFAHGDPLQRKPGLWYFHKQGSAFRGGTYKGLDISFGGQASGAGGKPAYGGVLIRAIEPVKATAAKGGGFVEGPCMTVDTILKLCGAADIASLLGLSEAGFPNVLYLSAPAEGTKLDRRALVEAPRVGLSMKRVRPGLGDYVMRPMRFLTRPKDTKKGKALMALHLHLHKGMSVADTRSLTNTPNKALQGYIDSSKACNRVFIVAGSKKKLQSFIGKSQSGAELYELYGAVLAASQSQPQSE